MPTKWPGLPTLMLDRENHTPITNGYAMNTPSSTTVGARSTNASKRSFSSRPVSARRCATREPGSATSTRVAPPAPPAIGFFTPRSCPSCFVDLLQLALSPVYGVLGLRALHGLGVHVDDDVLRVGLGGLGSRRAGMAERARQPRRLPKHLQRLVDFRPHWALFPFLGGADAVAFIDLEPPAVVRVLVQPLQEVLGELLVLRVLHDRVLEGQVEGELAGRAPRHQRGVLDVLVERLALLVLDLVLLTLGDDVDRRAVERGADLAGVEGAVVVGVVPGQAALVAGVPPERLEELHRLERALRVDRDLLAARVNLGTAEVPEKRVGKDGRIAEAVTQRLADGLALGLELLADLAVFLPGLGEFLDAELVEPRTTVGDGVAAAPVRHGEPLAADLGARVEDVVVAALRLADRLGHVGDVDEGVGVELRPVPQHLDDVGAGARLDGGGDARLQVVGVDELERDLGSQRLRRLRGLAPQLDVGLGDEVDPPDDVELGALRERGSATRRQDACHAGRFQKRTSLHAVPLESHQAS